MTAIERPERARIDREGHLVEADATFASLQQRAGGRIGGPVAVPAIAALARLVRRIGAPVSRAVIAADGEDDVELWLRGRTDGDDVLLTATAASRRAPAPPLASASPARAFDRVRADAAWTFEVDAALRFRALPLPGLRALGSAPGRPVVGVALTRLLVLEDEEAGAGGGGPPLLDALATARDFDRQMVRARATGARFRLAATVLLDAGGAVRGFRGAAYPAADDDEAREATDAAAPARLEAALRAPLGRIVSAAEAIRAAEDAPLRADYIGYAEDIATAGRHLLGLIDDLGDADAVEAERIDALIEPVDMADLARRAAGLLAVRADEKRIRIARPAEDARAPALGDFRRALQVLVNLIGNAVRFAPAGTAVTVAVERRGTAAAAIVIDEGRGIAPADRERAFAKFERLGAREPGSGLGLYISRRLARAMAGDVTIESGAGEGARFVFTLPLA